MVTAFTRMRSQVQVLRRTEVSQTSRSMVCSGAMTVVS
jgi:hypothetical protein